MKPKNQSGKTEKTWARERLEKGKTKAVLPKNMPLLHLDGTLSPK